jgi:plastocyanin
LLLGAALVLTPRGASADRLSGEIRLGDEAPAASDLASTIVWFVPDQATRAPATPTRVEIQTRDRRFAPHAIAVPVGSTVVFPNSDPIRHNVFSVSTGNRFDLGLYGTGPGRSQRFDRAGLVRVFCNVHRSMSAYVMVLDTPYFASASEDGRFELAGLPAGSGTLHVWNPRGDEWTRALTLPSEQSIAVRLAATLPAVPQHLNKFGQPYQDDAGDGGYR